MPTHTPGSCKRDKITVDWVRLVRIPGCLPFLSNSSTVTGSNNKKWQGHSLHVGLLCLQFICMDISLFEGTQWNSDLERGLYDHTRHIHSGSFVCFTLLMGEWEKSKACPVTLPCDLIQKKQRKFNVLCHQFGMRFSCRWWGESSPPGILAGLGCSEPMQQFTVSLKKQDSSLALWACLPPHGCRMVAPTTTRSVLGRKNSKVWKATPAVSSLFCFQENYLTPYSRNTLWATDVIAVFQHAQFQREKRIYFILSNISKIVSFQNIVSIKILNEKS